MALESTVVGGELLAMGGAGVMQRFSSAACVGWGFRIARSGGFVAGGGVLCSIALLADNVAVTYLSTSSVTAFGA